MVELRESIYNKRGIYGIKNKINNKIYVGKTQVNFGDMTNREIADKYNIPVRYVQTLVKYERWKNLKPPIN